ncbi:MAG: hypothetical protein Q7R69_01780 [bacterium]|nr:hypothetical protein [bacterium]
MEEHISKANGIARDALEELRAIKERGRGQLFVRYILAKLADLFIVILSLIIIGIVIYLFTESIFEGFISAVTGYISISYFFKMRSRSLLSWFFGRFEFNK